MKYKLDKKGSNKISKIFIIIGLALILAGPGKTFIKIFEQHQGAEINNNIVNSVIVEDKQDIAQADGFLEDDISENDINEVLEEQNETYIPKYNIAELQENYPNAWGILEKPDGSAFPIASTNSDEEENYYLNHTLDGTYNTSGCLFLDNQNDKGMQNQVTRIWGHNLLAANMFGDLTEYQNQGQSFYEQHKTYTLYTKNGVYSLEVFAALEEDGTLQEFDYQSQDDFLKDMQENRSASNFTSDVTIEPDNKIVVLACCPDRGSAISGNNRFFVYTKVTPIYEYNLNNSKTL